ncbi:MAG: glycosyltransferase family 2 protein [Bacteroidota bacterium]|nr:glycosyltransferase family 2 protein [Bacteroidota bacterium]
MTDIIIVNWNSGNYLEKCITSIFSNSNERFVNMVFIIDNSSSDLSVKNILPNDKIQIIRNNENKGFAKASNQGFLLSKSPYVLLLNPDTQLLDTTLKDCIAFMERHPETDILGCRLLNDEGETSSSCARFPTPLKLFMDSVGFSKVFPKVFTPAILMSDWDHKTSRYVDQVMGAFMFMRYSIFEKVGYFDERFFVYCEELDFSKRLHNLGGKSFFNTDIVAIHSGEGTTKAVKAFRLFLNLRSRLQYARKHFTTSGYWLVWFGTYFIEPFTRTFFLLLSGRFKEIKTVFIGYTLFIRKANNQNSKSKGI